MSTPETINEPIEEGQSVSDIITSSEHDNELTKQLLQLQDDFESLLPEFLEMGIQPVVEAYADLSAHLSSQIENWLQQLKANSFNNSQPSSKLLAQNIEDKLQDFVDKNGQVQSEAISQAILHWKESVDDIIEKAAERVTLNITNTELQKSEEDDSSLRRAKRKLRLLNMVRHQNRRRVPFREVLNNVYDVSGKPALHKAMGEFSLGYFRILNEWRSLLARELKLLLLSLQSANETERKEILSNRSAAFRTRAEELTTLNSNILDDARKSLQNLVSDVIERTEHLSMRLDVKSELRRRKKKLNVVALSNLNLRLLKFNEVWKNNQQAYHNQLIVDLWLDEVSLSVSQFSQRIAQQLSKDYFEPVAMNSQKFIKAIARIDKYLKQENTDDHPEIPALNDQIFLSHRTLVNRLEVATDDFANTLPQESTLLMGDLTMSAIAFTRKVPTLTIPLRGTADYLIKTNYTELHRTIIINTISALNKLNSRLLNGANLMNYTLEMAKDDRHYAGVEDVFIKIKQDVAGIEEQLGTLKNALDEQLNESVNNTMSALDIRSVTARADNLKQHVDQKKTISPLQKWMGKKLYRLNLFWKKFSRFVVRRRHEAVIARFEKKNSPLINEGEQIQSFIEQLRISPEMDKKLPYYYKQLFSGKHLSTTAGIRLRNEEISSARKSVDRLREGSGGAIAVVGDALTGKTFLAEYVASEIIKGKVFRVSAPPGGSNNADDLNRAVLSVCGSPNENIRSVLASLEAGSVFVFNDLEQWWMKQSDGDQAIRALCVLIEKFSRRHFFIFTCNSYSFRLISETTALSDWLLSTIIIRPVTQDQMREIIWMRHETGGLILESMGKRVEQLSGRAWESLMTKFYRRSKGNVGLALRFWLCGIRQVNGDAIRVEDPGLLRFPDIKNVNWKVIIYQLFLHRALSSERLLQMFEDEGAEWLRVNIRALKRIGLIEETSREVFALNDFARPYIEDWFASLKLIT